MHAHSGCPYTAAAVAAAAASSLDTNISALAVAACAHIVHRHSTELEVDSARIKSDSALLLSRSPYNVSIHSFSLPMLTASNTK
eukprot:14684-Heterococcus_DN1.PRE.3